MSHTHILTDTFPHAYIDTYAHTYTHAHAQTHFHMHAQTDVWTHTHAHMYPHMHTHMHTLIRAQRPNTLNRFLLTQIIQIALVCMHPRHNFIFFPPGRSAQHSPLHLALGDQPVGFRIQL